MTLVSMASRTSFLFPASVQSTAPVTRTGAVELVSAAAGSATGSGGVVSTNGGVCVGAETGALLGVAVLVLSGLALLGVEVVLELLDVVEDAAGAPSSVLLQGGEHQARDTPNDPLRDAPHRDSLIVFVVSIGPATSQT